MIHRTHVIFSALLLCVKSVNSVVFILQKCKSAFTSLSLTVLGFELSSFWLPFFFLLVQLFVEFAQVSGHAHANGAYSKSSKGFCVMSSCVVIFVMVMWDLKLFSLRKLIPFDNIQLGRCSNLNVSQHWCSFCLRRA